MDEPASEKPMDIDKFIMLAPAVYGHKLVTEITFVTTLKAFPKFISTMIFGNHAFIPVVLKIRWLLQKTALYGWLEFIVITQLFNWKMPNVPRNWLPTMFLWTPVYTSVKLIYWWLSIAADETILQKEGTWFQYPPPDILVIHSDTDNFVNCDLLIEKLKAEGGKVEDTHIDNYSHPEFVSAWDSSQLTGGAIVNFILK